MAGNIVTPEAVVLSFEWGCLRRASASGDPSLVLASVERILRGHETPSCQQEAREAFYRVFWVALEDDALSDKAGAIDLLMSRTATANARTV